MKDCLDYYNNGYRDDGVYTLYIHGDSRSVSGYCNMQAGGYTVSVIWGDFTWN